MATRSNRTSSWRVLRAAGTVGLLVPLALSPLLPFAWFAIPTGVALICLGTIRYFPFRATTADLAPLAETEALVGFPFQGRTVLALFRNATWYRSHEVTLLDKDSIGDDALRGSESDSIFRFALVRENGLILGAYAFVVAFTLFVAPWIALFTDASWRGFLSLAAIIASAVHFALARILLAVGRDGVMLTTSFGSRFVAYSTIDAVDVGEGDKCTVYLRLTNQETLSIIAESSLTKALLADHIQRRRHLAIVDSDASVGLSQLLVLTQRSRSWTELVRFSRESPKRGYRDTSNALAFARVVEGSLSEPKTRAAAALLLRITEGEEGARRIRVATEGMVDQRLRVALVKIADGQDEQEITKALEAFQFDP